MTHVIEAYAMCIITVFQLKKADKTTNIKRNVLKNYIRKNLIVCNFILFLEQYSYLILISH